jgi:hypothetical protein
MTKLIYLKITNTAKSGWPYTWIDLSLLNLCLVALMGLLLRSKIVFALPMINYNHLLEAHAHFSFGGWATLLLTALFVKELLPQSAGTRPIYQWFLGAIALLSWGMLISFLIWGTGRISEVMSLIFVLITYLFGSVLIRDICKSKLNPSITLLAVSSIICLILSSSGVIAISYINYSKSLDFILDRDALFTYLHFQYNGFFTLAVFALLFNHIHHQSSLNAVKHIRMFSMIISISVLPTLFLSYLWQDPNVWFRIIAIAGSLLLLFCFYLFLVSVIALKSVYHSEKPVLRFLLLISLGSYMLKIVLQSFTIFPMVGNAIFGNRPVIMGFLHLVFLAFMTLFLLTYLTKINVLNGKFGFTRMALVVFAIAVILNEVLLGLQGLTSMLMAGSSIFSWLLWISGIGLFAGTLLLAVARIRSKKMS